MKLSLIYTGLALLVLSGCSTAYKAGQTPDDVYYSPAREADEYVVVARAQDRYQYNAENYYEDRYLRMRVLNRNRWSALDYYYNNPYAFSPFAYYHSWNDPWNSYWAWNNFYNPYFNPHFGWGGWGMWTPGVIVGAPVKPVTRPSRALVFNPASYLPNDQLGSYSKTPGRFPGSSYTNSGRYNNSNSNNNNTLGGSLRRMFNNGGSNNSYDGGSRGNTNTNTPTRSYNPSSSSSSGGSSGRSSGGSSGGGGGVSRPIR